MISDLLNGVAIGNSYWANLAPTPALVANNYLSSAEGKEIHQILWCI